MDIKIEFSLSVLNFSHVDTPEKVTVIVRADSTEESAPNLEINQVVISGYEFKQSYGMSISGYLSPVGNNLFDVETMKIINKMMNRVQAIYSVSILEKL
jgi:hypothetical protein